MKLRVPLSFHCSPLTLLSLRSSLSLRIVVTRISRKALFSTRTVNSFTNTINSNLGELPVLAFLGGTVLGALSEHAHVHTAVVLAVFAFIRARAAEYIHR